MMHGRGKSDFAIVATKPANNAERSAAEPVERRAETKGNAGQQSTHRTQSRASVSQALELIRQAAPEARVPAETTAANHRGRRYNSRCYDNWRRGCDYDWTSIRETSSVRTTMKARTTSARSAGTVNVDE